MDFMISTKIWPIGNGPRQFIYVAANKNTYQYDFAGILNNAFSGVATASYDFTPTTNSSALSGADYTNLPDNNGYTFKHVNYKGAFGPGDTWHQGWTNFNPDVTSY